LATGVRSKHPPTVISLGGDDFDMRIMKNVREIQGRQEHRPAKKSNGPATPERNREKQIEIGRAHKKQKSTFHTSPA